ncbi:hypothetical protein DDB_G0294270 [Dictyostelium discoideum AX4]|uniref:Uncharacterized protein n=1 Tax=Dictyostelium discoideum TaxID=44689 RepID=Q54AR1_DICDI|nr:hypothetical protein DDB_G0294270 [Dictyostelium discoideum AX4]EAL60346.1 hypothetical protein DDB_G0294270 [Dictyostelium discoideum AX4]|eukprot:XP_628759.1 hypothetical protein DDB_G0294270 [Dictyostelium discoideum AX4]
MLEANCLSFTYIFTVITLVQYHAKNLAAQRLQSAQQVNLHTTKRLFEDTDDLTQSLKQTLTKKRKELDQALNHTQKELQELRKSHDSTQKMAQKIT